MSELSKGFAFDLSYPLARYSKNESDLLQRLLASVINAESESKYLLLPFGKRIQHIADLLLEMLERG